MHRLSRQLAASSRLIHCSNVCINRRSALSICRRYTSGSSEGPDATNSAKASSQAAAPQSQPESSKQGSSQPTPEAHKVNNLDELIELLESQDGQETLLLMPNHATHEFKQLMSKVVMDDGEGNVTVMHHVAGLLSRYGLNMEITAPVSGNTNIEDVLSEEELATLRRLELNEDEEFEGLDPLEVAKRKAESAADVRSEEEVEQRPYPNLMSPDPLMDSRDVLELHPTPGNPYHNRVVVRNHRSMFHEAMALDGFNFDDPKWIPTRTDLSEEEISPNESAGLEPKFPVGKLFKFTLLFRWVTQQTGKGKIKKFQVFVVTGDGNGMVGLGMGTDEEAANAHVKAHIAALKNMDYVDRFENRTIWTEMSSKFRSTQINMRPRPVGFGLRCSPILHQILKAAGIKDVSAKVWGSRNPIMIMQGALKMLQGGHNPLGMGDGIGGKGKRLVKGIGMRTQFDVERERGRKLYNYRK